MHCESGTGGNVATGDEGEVDDEVAMKGGFSDAPEKPEHIPLVSDLLTDTDCMSGMPSHSTDPGQLLSARRS